MTGFIQDLHLLEDQLHKGEDELQNKRKEFEEQRQNELDRIEVEKFKLQEMEHEERINALVEQEVLYWDYDFIYLVHLYVTLLAMLIG